MAKKKRLLDKAALSEFSTRELLELLVANQINIFRQLKYLRNKLNKGEEGSQGPYENTVYQLLKDADSIFRQADEFLSRDEKGDGEPYPIPD